MTYKDTAPLVSGTGITKAQVITYFSNVAAPAVAKPVPTVTKANVQAIADKMFGSEDYSISKLAGELGLNTGQVKTIISEIKTLHQEYLTPVEEVTPE